jgi:ubiquinone/menaquinone biosynthesis C-methylase UbiE
MQQTPSPAAIVDAAFAFQQTFALKAGVDCDVFTAIGEGQTTVTEIAKARNISEKGARVLCDYLTTLGFLKKNGNAYSLAPDAAMFLDKRSPAYMGAALEFLAAPQVIELTQHATDVVRAGTTGNAATMEPDHEVWPVFARAMASFMALPAMLAAQVVPGQSDADIKVLDIAAGHGEFGFAVARRFPKSWIVAVDSPAVLAVAEKRAQEAGLADRFVQMPGDAFQIEVGRDYDAVLIPNFLHHFDEKTNVGFLRKMAAAVKPGGHVIIVEFVPNEDRVTPPMPARFALTMLTNTEHGDAYTLAEFTRMLEAAGFTVSESRPLVPTPFTAIAARKS